MTSPSAPLDATRLRTGLLIALASAFFFGLSGTLAKGLLDTGWSPAAAVTLRVSLGALVLLVPGVVALRGDWSALRRNLPLISAYGLIAVAGCQFAYFSAVVHLQVGVALLVEYTAPVAVVLWLWLRHAQRPALLTVAGAAVAGVGLALVLDVLGTGSLSAVGLVWALLAMVGAATYFVLSAHLADGLPPVSMAAGGLVIGALALVIGCATGVLEWRATTAPAAYDGATVPWWLPVLGLGLLSGACAYVTGIAASRRLGSRLASFVALSEVVCALVAAWVVLGEQPRPVQLLGGVAIVAGVVLVKLGEPREPALSEHPVSG